MWPRNARRGKRLVHWGLLWVTDTEDHFNIPYRSAVFATGYTIFPALLKRELLDPRRNREGIVSPTRGRTKTRYGEIFESRARAEQRTKLPFPHVAEFYLSHIYQEDLLISQAKWWYETRLSFSDFILSCGCRATVQSFCQSMLSTSS